MTFQRTDKVPFLSQVEALEKVQFYTPTAGYNVLVLGVYILTIWKRHNSN